MGNTLIPVRGQIPGYSNYVRNNFPIAEIEKELLKVVSQKPIHKEENQNRALARPRPQADLPVMSDFGEDLSYEHMRLLAGPLKIALQGPLRI